MNVLMRRMLVAGFAAAAMLVIACGSESETAPAVPTSNPGAPVVTPTPSVLSELVALRVALELKDGGHYSEMDGEPSAVWGAVMTYREAAQLSGAPISSNTSEYDRNADLVWYFVLEGQLIDLYPAPPGSPEPDRSPKFGVVGMLLDAFTGGIRSSSSSTTGRDLGQSQMPRIDVPADIYDTPMPTPAPRSTAPAATAAPPATAAPMAPTVTPVPPATAAPKPTSSPPPAFSPDGGPFESALWFVPDQPEHRILVRMNNLDGLRSVTGIEAPGSEDDNQRVIDYKSALVLAESLDGRPFLPGSDWLSGFNRNYLAFAPSTRTSLGFDSRDIDLILTTGPEGAHPARGMEVVIGAAINANAAASLLQVCEECVPHEVATHSGVEFFTWGNDSEPSLSDRLGIPAHDEFGRGGRILIGDGYAVRTLFTESMEDTINVVTDPARGLFGNEDFVLAARATDEMRAVSLTLTSQPFRAFDIAEVYGGRGRLTDDGLDPDFEGQIAALNAQASNPDARETLVVSGFVQSGSMPAFEVVATGVGSDAKGLFVTLAMVFVNDANANDAATALQARIETGVFPTFSEDAPELTPWNEEIESAEITVTGRTVTAQLRVTDPNRVQQKFILRGAFEEGVGFTSLMMFLIAHE